MASKDTVQPDDGQDESGSQLVPTTITITPDDRKVIRRAAVESDTSFSRFIVDAGLREAQRVLSAVAQADGDSK